MGQPASAPRYEYRIFLPADDERVSAIADVMHGVAGACDSADYEDVYLLSDRTVEASAKLRNSRVEVKLLVRCEADLELWRPGFEADLPVSGAMFQAHVLAPLCVSSVLNVQQLSSASDMIAVAAAHADLAVATVRKARRQFRLPEGRAEVVQLEIDASGPMATLAVESESRVNARELARHFGLLATPNISYPRFLRERMSAGTEPRRPAAGLSSRSDMEIPMSKLGQINVQAARLNPEGAFGRPDDVFEAQILTRGEKLAILKRWSLLVQRRLESTAEGMPPEGTTDNDMALLDEIREVVIRLEGGTEADL